ncbi:MAG: hypothetical protein PHI55_15495, partial [Burkholderiaceae bacterium]|nr:hypothetical protein [Burkholderiaceae bacterium]
AGLSAGALLRLSAQRRARGFALVAGIYLVQYLLGLGLVRLWVQGWQAPAWCAPLFATALVLPLTFALQRWVFRDRGGRA